MVVDTKSIGSEPCSWEESLFLNESEVLKSCPIKQELDIAVEETPLRHESFHKEQSNCDTERTYKSTSRDSRDDDEDSYSWEELFPDEKEDEGGVPIASCEDLGWQHQSSMSSFSIYFDIEASCEVSVLDDESMEEESLDEESLNHNSECTEESCGDDLSFKPTLESESSSLSRSEVIETDEDSVQSAYEVKSVMNEMSDERVDCSWGPLNFEERAKRRKEKRSRTMHKMFELGSSLSKLEYMQVEASSLASEINEMKKDSAKLDGKVKSFMTDIGDKGVNDRCGTRPDFAGRIRRRKEKRSRIMAKMNHFDSLMKRDTDDFAERTRRRKEKRSRIMAKMFELGSSMSKLEHETN